MKGQGQRIRYIVCDRLFLKVQYPPNHEPYLLFRGPAPPDHAFLDFPWGILKDWQMRFGKGKHDGTPRVAHLHHSLGVPTEKNRFQSHLIRLDVFDRLQEAVVNFQQTFLERKSCIRAERFTRNEPDLSISVLHHAYTGDGTAGIDTQDNHKRYPVV